jgi:hypothetical protein
MAHACNPSYSGGRDEDDHGLKPVQANSLQDPISKILITKRAGEVAQGEGPEFKSQYCKKASIIHMPYNVTHFKKYTL